MSDTCPHCNTEQADSGHPQSGGFRSGDTYKCGAVITYHIEVTAEYKVKRHGEAVCHRSEACKIIATLRGALEAEPGHQARIAELEQEAERIFGDWAANSNVLAIARDERDQLREQVADLDIRIAQLTAERDYETDRTAEAERRVGELTMLVTRLAEAANVMLDAPANQCGHSATRMERVLLDVERDRPRDPVVQADTTPPPSAHAHPHDRTCTAACPAHPDHEADTTPPSVARASDVSDTTPTAGETKRRCKARRVHPISTDYYVPCALSRGHGGDHSSEDEAHWSDEHDWALRTGDGTHIDTPALKHLRAGERDTSMEAPR